jgi:N-acetylglucosaminyldiphosphoundecaprenol N-acetyl-beta-D-mannosaminyltransferase
MQVLGVQVSEVTRNEALKKAEQFLFSNKQHTIFTPNPEMVVKAQTDLCFKEVLNKGDLNLCDGAGLAWAVRRGKGMVERITGVDFMLELCALAERNNKKIFLLGSGKDYVVQKTAEYIHRTSPSLQIAGIDKGLEIKEILNKKQVTSNNGTMKQLSGAPNLLINEQDNALLIKKINATMPDILFVAFGMGKQEKWIVENIARIPSVKIAMGIGGAFDYISETVPRAPLLLRNLGLEWAYRLVKEPKRFKRIWNATVVFSYLVFRNKSL